MIGEYICNQPRYHLIDFPLRGSRVRRKLRLSALCASRLTFAHQAWDWLEPCNRGYEAVFSSALKLSNRHIPDLFAAIQTSVVAICFGRL